MEGRVSVEGSSRLFGIAVVESCGHLGTGQESFTPLEQQEFPAPLSPAADGPSTERKGHCCAWDCCCREPDLWGKGYCSCGLLKWYCSGKHQCMQLADECATGTDPEEPPVWETYRLFSSWGKNAGYGSSTPTSWPREEKGDSLIEKTECRRGPSCGEDHSTESSPCSVLLNQTNSRNFSTTSPEKTQSEEEWGTTSMWWSQEWITQGAMESSERWRHFGDWKVDEECSDEDCMCNAICSFDEECSCNEVDNDDDDDECVLNESALQAVDICRSRWKASLDPEDICKGPLPKDGDRSDINNNPFIPINWVNRQTPP